MKYRKSDTSCSSVQNSASRYKMHTTDLCLNSLSTASVQPRHLTTPNQWSAAAPSPTIQPATLLPLPWLLWSLLLLLPHPSRPLLPIAWCCPSATLLHHFCLLEKIYGLQDCPQGEGTRRWVWSCLFFTVKKADLSMWHFGKMPLVHRLSDIDLYITILRALSERFICRKKTRSRLVLSIHLPLLTSRCLERVPTCVSEHLYWEISSAFQVWCRGCCSCTRCVPLAAPSIPSVLVWEWGSSGMARGAVSTHPGEPSWGWLKTCHHFHKATCNPLHLHCQTSFPMVPILRVHLFSLWITPGNQEQSAS